MKTKINDDRTPIFLVDVSFIIIIIFINHETLRQDLGMWMKKRSRLRSGKVSGEPDDTERY